MLILRGDIGCKTRFDVAGTTCLLSRHSELASRIPPNGSQPLPLHCCNCIWLQIMLLDAVVLTSMPGNAVGSATRLSDFACLTMFFRERSLPHCLRICSRIMPCM